MPKVIYDVVQRFEVDNNIPRLVATNIQVVKGGEDLMSVATSLLNQLGFEQRFQENRTSQYIGYRLRSPGKSAKRYQLVLAQRKDGLCVSLSKDILDAHILELMREVWDADALSFTELSIARVWVRPSREDRFLDAMKQSYGSVALKVLNGDLAGNSFCIRPLEYEFIDREGNRRIGIYHDNDSFNFKDLGNSDNYLILNEDQLFPYTWQVSITSTSVLKEFLTHFSKILIEKNAL